MGIKSERFVAIRHSDEATYQHPDHPDIQQSVFQGNQRMIMLAVPHELYDAETGMVLEDVEWVNGDGSIEMVGAEEAVGRLVTTYMREHPQRPLPSRDELLEQAQGLAHALARTNRVSESDRDTDAKDAERWLERYRKVVG